MWAGVILRVALGLVLTGVAVLPPAQAKDQKKVVLENEVQGLLDREAIRQLPILYCHYVISRDVEGFANLFTEDGRYDFPTTLNHEKQLFVTGRDKLRETLASNLDVFRYWPSVFNHVIELTGPDTAKGYVYLVMRLGTKQYQVTQVGRYVDDYVRVNGEWKFKRRILELHDVG